MPPDGGPAPAVEVPALDLSQPRSIHIVGVAGVGMSAIALLLARMGHDVSGSDIKDSAVLARLRAAGVTVNLGNRAAHVPAGADAVVYSTAIPPANVELVQARKLGIDVVHRASALAGIVATRRTVAIAGSHGKTTTSSMLALVLRHAGWQPSFVIGGELNEVGTNAAFGHGEWLVVEADESDGTFLHLRPEAAIVTNIEPDHLDYYGDFDALVHAFGRFVDAVPGSVVIGADDPVAAALARSREIRVRTFGEDPRADYRIASPKRGPDGCRFTLTRDGVALGELSLPLGVRVEQNAAAAVAMACELGIEFGDAARALAGFGGVARRFQHRGEQEGVTFVDDYAHLPGEVVAAIDAARQGAWRRVIVVFQPHRYSRTAALWQDFADVFTGADTLVLTDVYAAGETPVPGVSGRLLVHAVLDRHPSLAVSYLPKRADLVNVPGRYARPGDVVLTLGAGDLTTLPSLWLGDALARTDEDDGG